MPLNSWSTLIGIAFAVLSLTQFILRDCECLLAIR